MSASDPIPTRIVHRRRIANGTHELTLDLGKPLDFKAGQYIAITLSSLPVDPPYRVREFSLVSAPSESHLTIAFRSSATDYKRAILDPAYAGPIITRGPLGFFTPPPNPSDPHVFIAGGIGIAPFMSILRDIATQPPNQSITLLRIESNPGRSAYRSELGRLVQNIPNLKIIEHFGRLIDSGHLAGLLPNLTANSQVYIAGPLGMTGHTRTIVRELGIHPLHIHLEEFTGYPGDD